MRLVYCNIEDKILSWCHFSRLNLEIQFEFKNDNKWRWALGLLPTIPTSSKGSNCRPEIKVKVRGANICTPLYSACLIMKGTNALVGCKRVPDETYHDGACTWGTHTPLCVLSRTSMCGDCSFVPHTPQGGCIRVLSRSPPDLMYVSSKMHTYGARKYVPRTCLEVCTGLVVQSQGTT